MLEYIESDGNQCIDTNFMPNNNTRTVMDCEITGAQLYPAPFGTQDTSSTAMYLLVQVNNVTARLDYGNSRFTIANNFSGRHLIDLNKGKLYVDENLWYDSSKTFSCSTTLYLFAHNVGGEIATDFLTKGKIYSCKIYNNDILVRDYVPALRSDGIAGLYDKVNDIFYASNGSGNFIAGTKVEEIIAIQTSVTGTYKIPFGFAYTVTANEVSKYYAPSIHAKVANSVKNIVSMQYIYDLGQGLINPTIGIWIQSTDNRYYTIENWGSVSKTPNGIAVVTNECQFVIALDNISGLGVEWGGFGTVVSNASAHTEASAALTDYSGEANTDAILTQLGYDENSTYAAYYCRNYTFPNGKRGYLGALGEWQAVLDNKTDIDTAINKCEGGSIATYYWSSTQYDSEKVWCLYFNHNGVNHVYKNGSSYARAFCSI